MQKKIRGLILRCCKPIDINLVLTCCKRSDFFSTKDTTTKDATYYEVQCDIENYLTFITGGYNFSLIWDLNSVDLFDSQSRDINGHFVKNRCAILLKFDSIYAVQHYIKNEYLMHIDNFEVTQ